MTQGTDSKKTSLAKRERARRHKKTLATVVVALSGVLLVGGSVAYLFTSTDSVENSFEPSGVSCVVNESFADGGLVKSNVKIQNTGNVDAYIRAEIVVNWVKEKTDTLGEKDDLLGIMPVAGVDYTIEPPNEGWRYEGSDGFYYYEAAVAGKGYTTCLIPSCKVENTAPEGYVLQVEVIASAIQADGEVVVQNNMTVPVVTEVWKSGVAGVDEDGNLILKSNA